MPVLPSLQFWLTNPTLAACVCTAAFVVGRHYCINICVFPFWFSDPLLCTFKFSLSLTDPIFASPGCISPRELPFFVLIVIDGSSAYNVHSHFRLTFQFPFFLAIRLLVYLPVSLCCLCDPSFMLAACKRGRVGRFPSGVAKFLVWFSCIYP